MRIKSSPYFLWIRNCCICTLKKKLSFFYPFHCWNYSSCTTHIIPSVNRKGVTHGIGFGLGNSLHNKLLSLIDSVPLFGCSVPSTIFENSDPSHEYCRHLPAWVSRKGRNVLKKVFIFIFLARKESLSYNFNIKKTKKTIPHLKAGTGTRKGKLRNNNSCHLPWRTLLTDSVCHGQGPDADQSRPPLSILIVRGRIYWLKFKR